MLKFQQIYLLSEKMNGQLRRSSESDDVKQSDRMSEPKREDAERERERE